MRAKIHTGVFNRCYLPYIKERRRFEIIYGGAGSGKSVFVAQKKILQHARDTGRKTLVVRKVGTTVRHSAFAELRNVIYKWNLESLFHIRQSTMEIERKDRSNIFIFTGMDNVEKIKSIQGLTDIWCEEATDLAKEDLMQLNLRLRGRTSFQKQITLTFNPISALHWIKQMFFDTNRAGKNGDTTILKTTYKNNKFIDEEYKRTVEDLKNQDPVYYDIYALGNWGVLGNLIFNNYEVSEFDLDAFDESETFQGLDFGFNNPSAAVQVGFRDEEIFIRRGLYAKGLTNIELMGEVSQAEVFEQAFPIIADSSEPARIKEWKANGWRCRGADKFPGSVKFGIDFCRRHKIIIHPSMQPFVNEIQGYVYRQSKDGDVLEEPVAFRDHYMDGFRYALEPVMRNRKIQFG